MILCHVVGYRGTALTHTAPLGGLLALLFLFPLLTVSIPHAAAQAPPTAGPRVVTQARLRVAGFRVSGSTVFRANVLEALLQDAVGRDVTLQELEGLAERITTYYRIHGYILARALVPAQDIHGGIVEITVVEGKIGTTDIRGPTHYAPADLRPFLVRPGEVFHADRYERRLLILNDLPGIKATSTLQPGAATGEADVVVEVADRQITGLIEANNYGSTVNGAERFGLLVTFTGPLRLGDALSFRAFTSLKGDVLVTRFAYTIPVGLEGTRLGASYTRARSESGQQLRELNIGAAGDIVSAFLGHPFIRSRELNVFAQLGFDVKSYRTQLLGQPISEDNLRVITLGAGLEATHWRGVSQFGVTGHQGIGSLFDGLKEDDDKDASRPGAGGTYTKVTGEVSRLQQLYGPTSIFLRALGQWSNDRLVTPEEFAVGGQGTVRGYPIAEFLGDHGYALTAELRWNAPGFADRTAFLGKRWGDLLQFFVFVDRGAAFVIEPPQGQLGMKDLTGAGAGLRFTFPEVLNFKVEYARPVGLPRPSDGQMNVIYFQGTLQF